MWRLALPVVLVQLGMMALGVVDVIMVGHLSQEALAAVSLGNTYSFGLMILGMGTLHVLDPLISQAHGAGDERGKREALLRGLILAALLAVPAMAAMWFSRPLLLLLSDQPAVVPAAHDYARAVAPGTLAFFAFVVLRQSLQAMSIVRPVMVAVIVGNLANLLLDYALIYGHFGMPALGALGAGLASTLCRYLMTMVLAVAMLPLLRQHLAAPLGELLRIAPYLRMLGKGLHIGVQMSLEVWVFNAVAILMVRMGPLELAGHAVAMNLASLTFMVPLGIGAAAATRVGNAIGRRDPGAARLAARVALVMGGSVMVLSAACFVLFPQALAALYTRESTVVAMSVLLLPIAGLFQVFDGTQAVGCGILRGAGDTRVPALINLLGFWIIGLPGGCWLAYGADLGPRGLWLGLTIGLLVVAVLLVARVRSQLAGAVTTIHVSPHDGRPADRGAQGSEA